MQMLTGNTIEYPTSYPVTSLIDLFYCYDREESFLCECMVNLVEKKMGDLTCSLSVGDKDFTSIYS